MTTKEPIISVIIPTYNRAHIIDRAIRSVLDQTFSQIELIVVDDGSTDDTEEVVKGFRDPRLRFIRHETNRGASAARNTGINAARGEYIALQDSDDEWLPAKLERQMELFKRDKRGDLGLVLCEILIKHLQGEHHVIPRMKLITYENLFLHRADANYFTTQFLIKRDLTAAELYFDENLPASEDWDLLLRLARICRINYVPEVLSLVYIDSTNRMTNPKNRLKSRLLILQKYNAELKERPKALRSCYFDIAKKYHHAGEAINYVRHYLKAAIVPYPVHPVAYIGLAFSFLGRQSFRLFLWLYEVFSAQLRRLENISWRKRK